MADQLDIVEALPAAAWKPTRSLREHLLAGTLATLGAGGLIVAAGVAELAQPGAVGWTLADNLSWAALLPLALVLRTYLALGRESDSFALEKAAACLFGTMLLFQLFELATKNLLSPEWRAVVWVFFALGVLALVGGLLVPSSPGPSTSARTRGTGILGGVAAAVLVVLKLAGKGILAKVLVLRVLMRFVGHVRGDWTPLVLLLLVLAAASLLIWFAVCKIRLRDKWGGIAAFAGWAEILMVSVAVVIGVGILIATLVALEQPGLNERAQEQIVDEKGRQLSVLALTAAGFWTAITAFLFNSLRSLADPDPDWHDEPAP